MIKLKNMSHRHNRAMQQARPVPQLKTFHIVDPNHRPDLKGEFGGVKVERHGNKQVVRMTEAAARFYLDSGAIAVHEDDTRTPRPPGK
jgi:hypothetical protein